MMSEFPAVPPVTVVSSATLLSKSVSSGEVSQDEREAAVFSPEFYEAARHIKMRKELTKLELEVELLKEEKKNADVTHPFYLAGRLQALQRFCTHLRDVLKARELLAGQLARPVCHENLPVPAQLHSYVVETTHMAMEFVETLDEKRSTISKSGHVACDLDQLDSSVMQLTAQSWEVATLANRRP
ncbi:HAUS augmin-like complex subunit 2 [Corythoichthys intestinalis]|uniref:HAUS augmin-like complex subunit 2 n=1 Tax=Corythoichthys intestinalis TaxID=161448 RepID=UPI0025A65B26|nr:HAUS augmin-like complex subunit 2 [Corythoichthys intestinalis]